MFYTVVVNRSQILAKLKSVLCLNRLFDQKIQLAEQPRETMSQNATLNHSTASASIYPERQISKVASS